MGGRFGSISRIRLWRRYSRRKEESGVRTAREAFRKQRVMQASDRLRAGNRYRLDPLGPAFTDELGERLTPKAATDAFARLAKTAKVSTTSLHANASYRRNQPHRGRL